MKITDWPAPTHSNPAERIQIVEGNFDNGLLISQYQYVTCFDLRIV